MSAREWNPYWVAFAASRGRSPEEEAARQESRHEFIAWIGRQWEAFAKETGTPASDMSANREAFGTWLAARSHQQVR